MLRGAGHRIIRLAIVLAAFGLCACAGTGAVVSVSKSEVDYLLSGESLFGERAGTFELPSEDLFELTDEMKVFAEAQVDMDAQDSSRAISLHRALLHKSGLGMRYDPYKTYTASMAFDMQLGNCLAFTALYYSMARHLGIKAYINEVDVPASWDLQGDQTYVFFRHVNTKVKIPGGEKVVVDLDMDNYNPKYNQRRISEDDLRTQYFNNRAMEQLTTGNSEGAFRYLVKAISIDDEKAFLWSNLGVLFKRNQLFNQAEVAFRKALVVDPRNSTAASNLSRVYEKLGDSERAKRFSDLASSYRYRNPYYHYHLAEESLAAGDLDEALSLVNKAIRGFDGESRFYSLQAQVYVRQGKPEKAKRSLEKAVAQSKPNVRSTYERRADRLDSRISVY